MTRLTRSDRRATGSAWHVAFLSEGETSPTEKGAENGARISATSQTAQIRGTMCRGLFCASYRLSTARIRLGRQPHGFGTMWLSLVGGPGAAERYVPGLSTI